LCQLACAAHQDRSIAQHHGRLFFHSCGDEIAKKREEEKKRKEKEKEEEKGKRGGKD
jgi:hypothetical protein